MEWKASSHPILSCTFSFDETAIFSVDTQGQLAQDSVHKPGHRVSAHPLQGFMTSTLSSAMMMTTPSSNSIRSVGGSSIRSKSFIRTTSSGASASASAGIPRIQLEGGGSDIKGNGEDGKDDDHGSTTGGSKAKASALRAMNIGHGQLLGWSGDTDHVVMGCGNAGVIVQVSIHFKVFSVCFGSFTKKKECILALLHLEQLRPTGAATVGSLEHSDLCGLVAGGGRMLDWRRGRNHPH